MVNLCWRPDVCQGCPVVGGRSLELKLDTEFIRLPLDFEVERLQEEVLAVPEEAWRPHPQGHPGNSALPLIAVGGDPANDATSGRMATTPHLEGCEYLRQVLASFETVIGRARLMRLDGNAEATLHVDTNYYWAERVRIHVPIVTSPAIEFLCDERSLHMPEGQAWIFDAWRKHNVLNPTGDRRIHLVADTVGSARFWNLVKRGRRPFADDGHRPAEPQLIRHRPGLEAALELEQHNFPSVISPWELRSLALDTVLDGLGGDEEAAKRLREAVWKFLQDWRAAWARFGPEPAGLPTYRALLERLEGETKPLKDQLVLGNGMDPVRIVSQMMLGPAVNLELLEGSTPSPIEATPASPEAGPRRRKRSAPAFERPIFIVAPPRSGTSLLFETLAASPSVWTVGGESHGAIESIPELHPASQGWDSNRLGAAAAAPETVAQLDQNFLSQLRDRDGNSPPPESGPLRLLEKTPKNSLRVPFLAAAYPDCVFIYLHREPHESVSSMISAWESGRFVTYPNLPGWEGPPWSLMLVPGWRELAGRRTAEIAATQWTTASEILQADLGRLPADRWCVVGYHNLIADPQAEVQRLCRFAGIEWDGELSSDLPLSRHTLTPPQPDKWKQHKEALDLVLPATRDAAARSRKLLAKPMTMKLRAEEGAEADSPFRSVNAPSFPEILSKLESTLLLTTYQTGRVAMVRELDGKLNTHFRSFEGPTGISASGQDGRVAIGTRSQVAEYQNLPQLVGKLNPPERFDACYVPRRLHYTGDVKLHDVAYAGDELWIVATRFSSLGTLDDDHSFVPRWQPPFISDLAADDRCHLNGLAVVDDEPAFVTALGESDEPDGWRENRASGGVLIDVASGETVVSNLSMPHSPRWHRDRLWLLESGRGTLAAVDLEGGTVETVCELPGFTRGLAFAGPLAFVGISAVREAEIDAGLPLTDRLEERHSGIWVVNVETGQTVSFLRFEDLVDEIFDVALLPGIRFPEIAEHGSDAVNLSYVLPEAVPFQAA